MHLPLHGANPGLCLLYAGVPAPPGSKLGILGNSQLNACASTATDV
jgi:hypothetical protein